MRVSHKIALLFLSHVHKVHGFDHISVDNRSCKTYDVLKDVHGHGFFRRKIVPVHDG